MEKSKISIVAAAVAAVVLVGVIFYFTVDSSSKNTANCELLELNPDVTKNPKGARSADLKQLIYFTGHLKYELADSKNVYLPVDFDSIEYASKQPNYQVKLTSNCSTIYFNQTVDHDVTKTNKIKVELALPNGDAKECIIEDTSGGPLMFRTDYHYFCLETRKYLCMATSKSQEGKKISRIVASLVVEFIEFGLEEKPESVENWKFSTEEQYC